MAFINLQGRIIESDTDVFRTGNRSLRYGDGLFETMKVVNRRVLYRMFHYSRLILGMEALRINIPEEYSISFFDREFEKLLNAAEAPNGRLRLTMHRGGGGNYSPEHNEPAWFIEYFPAEDHYYELNSKGLKLGVYEEIAKPVSSFSALKTNNSLPYIMASIYASDQGLDDCLILNGQARIADATSSNVFLFDGSQLITPSEDEGGVSGVMRRVLIKIARKSGMDVIEQPVDIELLQNAKEVFLTNVINGIRWVEEYGAIQYGNEISGMLLAKLNEKILDELTLKRR